MGGKSVGNWPAAIQIQAVDITQGGDRPPARLVICLSQTLWVKCSAQDFCSVFLRVPLDRQLV